MSDEQLVLASETENDDDVEVIECVGAQGQAPSADFLTSNVDFDTRTIFLGCIEDGVGNHFVKALWLLCARGPDPVHVIINSTGGLFYDALAIYDAVRGSPVPMSCEVIGVCMSAAAFIAQAFTTRMIHPNATVMIHDGSTEVAGEAKNVELWAAQGKRGRERMYKLIAERSTKTPRYFQAKCARGDFIMWAEDAVKLGLFDYILQPFEHEPDTVEVKPA